MLAAVPVPLVIDADALTALGDVAAARTLLDKRSAPSILTPHDGEYARLAGSPPGADRLDAARRLAAATGAVVLLKGPLTAVAAPVGRGARRAARRGGRPGARHRRQRRRPVGDHRRVLRPWPRRPPGGGPGGARARPGGVTRALRGPGRRATSPAWWPGCCPGPGRCRIRRQRCGERPEPRWLRAPPCGWWPRPPTRTTPRRPWPRAARARRGRRSTWPPSPTTPPCWPSSSSRPSCARSSRHTGTATAGRRSPAPPWPAARSGLAVALVDEGVELRQHGVTAPVLLLSECGADAVETALAYGLTPTLYSAEGIEAFARAARAAGRQAAVHVKVDTGMHRVGARARGPAGARRRRRRASRRCSWRACGRTCRSPTARRRRTAPTPRGSWTSSTASSPAWPPTASRSPCCTPPTRQAPSRSPARATTWCAAASASTATCPATPCAPPSTRRRAGALLLPAMSLKARVVAVRTLDGRGAPLLRAPAPAARAVRSWRRCPIGYADGVPRALFGAGYEVLIGGVRRPLAGMVTMDQIVVDCGDDDSVRPGDEVVLLGRQGTRPITADDWAAMLGTISYEVVCGVGPAHAPHPGATAPTRPVPDADGPGAAARHRVDAAPCARWRRGGPRSSSAWATPRRTCSSWARGPGREEDLAGEPFVGRSGKLLDRLMWEEIGLTRAECYIANVVKCRPPQNRDPAPNEIEACRPYLDEQMTLIDPAVIVTLGNFATKLLLETDPGHPRACAGQVFERGRARLVPTYHPAYVLRAGGEAMAEMRADLVRAKRLIAEGRRERGPSGAPTDSVAGRRPGRLAGRLAPPVPGRRRRPAGRGPRRGQDGVRPGLRRRARGGRPGDQPDVRAGAPVPLRPRAARSGPSSTLTCTAPARWTRSSTWPWPSWSRRTRWPSSSGATWPRPALGESALEVTLAAPDPVGAPERRVLTDRRPRAAGRRGRPRSRGVVELRGPSAHRGSATVGRAAAGRSPSWRSRPRPRPSASPSGRRTACRPSSR